jgi:hypothetical protein
MKTPVLERSVEAALVRRISALGGVAIKLVAVRGLSDRLVVLPGGKVIAVELKRPKGGRLSPHQKLWIGRLRSLGVEVVVIRDAAGVDQLFAGMIIDRGAPKRVSSRTRRGREGRRQAGEGQS